MRKALWMAASAAILPLSANADTNTKKPFDHAPIGVMAEHNHEAGEWMTSYRYMRMDMDGSRDGDDRIPTSQVLSNFMVSPTQMTMEMHMFGVMYGVNDDLTLMGMIPYIENSMDHVTRMGGQFTTKSSGLGDITLAGLYTLGEKHVAADHSQQWLLKLGASLPTGDIDERDDTPAMANAKLPYPMQLGSGTIDPTIGITYLRYVGDWGFGSQANATFRLYDNSNDYHLGDEGDASVWVARNVSEFASVSFRLSGYAWGDIEGADPQLNPMMVPTARTDLRAGERVDASVGLNLYAPEGKLAGHRLAVEYATPIYQNLDGPQLETDHTLTLGWQLSF